MCCDLSLRVLQTDYSDPGSNLVYYYQWSVRDGWIVQDYMTRQVEIHFSRTCDACWESLEHSGPWHRHLIVSRRAYYCLQVRWSLITGRSVCSGEPHPADSHLLRQAHPIKTKNNYPRACSLRRKWHLFIYNNLMGCSALAERSGGPRTKLTRSRVVPRLTFKYSSFPEPFAHSTNQSVQEAGKGFPYC